ncbi:MAG: Holliday junction resolvase RuvX [Sinobacterium sp.]|nr:Holliday junction resolvase RuvX [Sinobacterium sp.]
MNENNQTVLCFDYGTKRIGIAYGSSFTGSGEVLKEIPARDGIPDWSTIEAIIKEFQPNTLLTGLPLNMDDTENDMCLRARKFARRLHGRFGIPSWMWDERLSSDEAKRIRPSSNYKKNAVDSLAAVIILESWFENGAPKQSA